MDGPYLYEIWVEGELSDGWKDWFQGMAIQADGSGSETRLCGLLPDQSALMGVLNKIHGLNLRLVEVRRVDGAKPPR